SGRRGWDGAWGPRWLDRPGALQLGAVHQPAGGGIEGVAAVHRAAVVPPDEVADLPVLAPGVFLLRRVRPQLVEQRLAFRHRQADDVGVDAAAEKQRLAPGLGMGAHHRLARPRHFRDILDMLEPGMRLAARGVGGGVDHAQPVDARLGRRRQVVVGGVAVEEIGRAAGSGRAAGGMSTNEESVCQNASPSPSPPIGLPSSTMLEITEISGGTSRRRPDCPVSTPYCLAISAAGLNSSSPNWRVKAMCCASLIGTPRKRSTRWSSQARRIASRSAGLSGSRISTPAISAPQPAAKGRTSTVIAATPPPVWLPLAPRPRNR